jgi:4-amino-4-deoxy-L-arabinose transferase-like glycosyltransferase
MELRGLRHAGLARQVNSWALALAGLTLIRLYLAAVLPLSPDEAYYFLWSLHLQPGYFDHPPMVALWIRAGTMLLGPTPLGVRLLGPLAAAAGSLLLWRAGEDFFPRRHAGILAAALLNATLMLGAGSVIMTPDTPLLFFWIAALAALARLLATGDNRWWLGIGAGAGAALLSKYTAGLLLAGVFFWLLGQPAGRRALCTPWPWAAALLAAALFAPNVYWNAAHGWVSYLKQGSRAAQFAPARAAQFLAELLAGQVALATPLIFGLAAAGLWRLRRSRDSAASLLLWLTLPPVAVFLQHVVADRVQANWPAIIYPAACLAAARLPAKPLLAWARPALGLGLAITMFAYAQALAAPFPIPAARDPAALQLAGWQPLAAAVAALNPAFITGDDYATIAELAFYGPPAVPVAAFGPRWQYFGMAPATALAGTTGILVTRRADANCPAVLGTLTRQRGAGVIATYRLCRVSPPADLVLLPRP